MTALSTRERFAAYAAQRGRANAATYRGVALTDYGVSVFGALTYRDDETAGYRITRRARDVRSVGRSHRVAYVPRPMPYAAGLQSSDAATVRYALWRSAPAVFGASVRTGARDEVRAGQTREALAAVADEYAAQAERATHRMAYPAAYSTDHDANTVLRPDRVQRPLPTTRKGEQRAAAVKHHRALNLNRVVWGATDLPTSLVPIEWHNAAEESRYHKHAQQMESAADAILDAANYSTRKEDHYDPTRGRWVVRGDMLGIRSVVRKPATNVRHEWHDGEPITRVIKDDRATQYRHNGQPLRGFRGSVAFSDDAATRRTAKVSKARQAKRADVGVTETHGRIPSSPWALKPRALPRRWQAADAIVREHATIIVELCTEHGFIGLSDGTALVLRDDATAVRRSGASCDDLGSYPLIEAARRAALAGAYAV